MHESFVRADGCVRLGQAVTCDGFSPDVPVRIQTHVHTDHMKDFARSKGNQRFIVCTKATRDLLYSEYGADLPARKPQWVILPTDGIYRRINDLDVCIALFPAGHMVGSAICATKYVNGTHYAYSSDFSWPLENVPVGPDVLIVDATYGDPSKIRNYVQSEVVNTFQQIVQERRMQGPVVVTGHRGRLQYAMQLMVDLFEGPYLVSKHVADTLDVYMHHQGFHVQYYELSTPKAREVINDGRYISLIESRDRTYLESISQNSKIFLSAFMVPPQEPVMVHANGLTRIALTDHADFRGTIELIEAIRPKYVIADGSRSGNAEALADFVKFELGIPATSRLIPTSRAWGYH